MVNLIVLLLKQMLLVHLTNKFLRKQVMVKFYRFPKGCCFESVFHHLISAIYCISKNSKKFISNSFLPLPVNTVCDQLFTIGIILRIENLFVIPWITGTSIDHLNALERWHIHYISKRDISRICFPNKLCGISPADMESYDVRTANVSLIKCSLLQKQPSRGLLWKSCSDNMLQICSRTPMPKCDFNKVA